MRGITSLPAQGKPFAKGFIISKISFKPSFAACASRLSKPSKSSKRILCVDDDQDTCETLSAVLDYAAYETTYALTVAERLSLVKKGGFDLIVLDWIFDDGTGVELCQ